MRTRQEILEAYDLWRSNGFTKTGKRVLVVEKPQALIIEILVDIRDLLVTEK